MNAAALQRYQNGEMSSDSGSAEDREQFLSALRSSIEIFVNRMRSNSQRGRSIANDSSVQTLFMTLTAMHPQLLQYVHQQEDQRGDVPTLPVIYLISSHQIALFFSL